MSCVPGGWFTRGIDDASHACDQADQPPDRRPSWVPASRVWVDSFYMDVYEVTIARYAECVAARGCTPARPLYRHFDASQQPITGMTWFQARDFCAWAGGHLPTDAEWEKAARGPDGDWWPWGAEPAATCERAILMDDTGRACGVPLPGTHPETGKIAEVGSRPAGRYGLYDMVGNAEEWVADWWTPSWEACGEDCAGVNPRGPCDGADECRGHRTKSIRGGSWYWPAEHATGWHRRRYRPSNDPAHHFGFRCAMSAAEYDARTSTP
ncbi:MAG: formylglycine-generating enzyme family protein [Myxococcales bacterium]|nr:formylglycine-generating enzyme family protein [Myxococcales bacterium]MCB9520565.1 formylglycine-generating enzyme family protein [Myxococcales bacterium]MCB9531488.1 formylglycine-generating enzyme family protein [Myxococcales bacterium]